MPTVADNALSLGNMEIDLPDVVGSVSAMPFAPGSFTNVTCCGFRKFWHANSGNSGTFCGTWQDPF